jgi:hypothetical protein
LAVLQKQYPNATEFDPFRFSRMREQAGEGIKHQMVTPSTDFLLFGLGRHAWYVSLLMTFVFVCSLFYSTTRAAREDSSQ